MRSYIFASILLATVAASAQYQAPGTSHATDQLVLLDHPLSACPVDVLARQQGSPQTYWTIAQEDQHSNAFVLHPHRPAGYGVHVDLNQSSTLNAPVDPINSITLQVFYFAPGTRAIPVDSAHNRANLSKTFRLNANSEALLHLEANLLVGPASGITRVHLQKIDYADGHTWTAPSETACSTTPSLYVPVSN